MYSDGKTPKTEEQLFAEYRLLFYQMGGKMTYSVLSVSCCTSTQHVCLQTNVAATQTSFVFNQ
jgi:hypothetical protein